MDGALLGGAVELGEGGRREGFGAGRVAFVHGRTELLDLRLELSRVGAIDRALLARSTHLPECGVVIRHPEKPLLTLNPGSGRANPRRFDLANL
jgi:hypothetical protein